LTFIYLFIDKTSGANLKMIFSIYKSPKLSEKNLEIGMV
jgi:hypothetical protein